MDIVKYSIVFLFSYLLFEVINAMIGFISRTQYPHVRVFVSFSVSRSKYWSAFVQSTLRSVFYRYNIDFYDFLEFAKKQDKLEIEKNNQDIDYELKKADIYIRCYDRNVEHQYRLVSESQDSMIFNPYTNSITESNPDYLFYETQIASWKYFSNRFDRIELILIEEYPNSFPNEKFVTAMYHSMRESDKKFAAAVAKKVHQLCRNADYNLVKAHPRNPILVFFTNIFEYYCALFGFKR